MSCTMNWVFLDGAFLPEDKAFIPVSDRGLLMGDGVYVTIQVLDGRPLFLQRHLRKLEEGAKGLDLHYLAPQVEWIEKLIECNQATKGVWRLKIYCTGGDNPAMRLPQGRVGHLLMILKPHVVPPFGPLRMGLYPFPVITPQSALKTLSHIGRYMIMEHALQRGFDDNVTTTEKGTLLETAFGNLFWVVDNHFYSPHPNLPLHSGVTIAVSLQITKDKGLVSDFVQMPLAEIPDNAHFFRTNAMGGIRPISCIENRQFTRNKELEEILLSSYTQLAEAEDKEESLCS